MSLGARWRRWRDMRRLRGTCLRRWRDARRRRRDDHEIGRLQHELDAIRDVQATEYRQHYREVEDLQGQLEVARHRIEQLEEINERERSRVAFETAHFARSCVEAQESPNYGR